MVEAQGTMVGINTGLPNRIAEEAILSGLLPSLSGYAELKREQKYGMNSRIDILLRDPNRPDAYVEVKNVHFSRRPGLPNFPILRRHAAQNIWTSLATWLKVVIVVSCSTSSSAETATV